MLVASLAMTIRSVVRGFLRRKISNLASGFMLLHRRVAQGGLQFCGVVGLVEEVDWEEARRWLAVAVEGVATWIGVNTQSEKTLWTRIWRILLLVLLRRGTW
jgi:hypothetical protein